MGLAELLLAMADRPRLAAWERLVHATTIAVNMLRHNAQCRPFHRTIDIMAERQAPHAQMAELVDARFRLAAT